LKSNEEITSLFWGQLRYCHFATVRSALYLISRLELEQNTVDPSRNAKLEFGLFLRGTLRIAAAMPSERPAKRWPDLCFGLPAREWASGPRGSKRDPRNPIVLARRRKTNLL